MHKIIHSKFQLDLSNYNISLVEENHWFSDRFFTKYSFPFEIFITDELLEAFGDFLDDNNQLLTTVFNVLYVSGNVLEDAILEVEHQIGRKLSTTIRYGFDELPNFDKKLNELSLEVTAITDILAHAKTIINQTWPAVNYNYPQIHTDKYDTTEATWTTFLKIINNYDGTNFLANDPAPATFANKNIIQPAIYLLHILTRGFLDAGYTLKGDITTNTLIKRILLFTDMDYFNFEAAPLTAIVGKNDYASLNLGIAIYNTDVALNVANQKYRVTGTVRMYSKYNLSTFKWETTISSISYKGNTLFQGSSVQNSVTTVNVDFEFTTDGAANNTQLLNLSTIQDYAIITDNLFDLTVEKIIETGANEIHFPVEVNLTKVAPDITFGNLISVVKNYLNVNLDIQGSDIYIDFIENSINYNSATDLSNYEILKKERAFESDKSFLLKFKDVTDAPTPYLPIFQNANIIELSDKNANDNTNIIEIDALPLPNKTEGVNTAFAFDHSGKTAIYFLLYNGIDGNGLNLAQDPSELMLANIHSSFYKKWFNFRVNAKIYRWKFKMYAEDLKAVVANFKIFGYKQYHIIKTLNKNQIAEDLFEVSIETETLP